MDAANFVHFFIVMEPTVAAELEVTTLSSLLSRLSTVSSKEVIEDLGRESAVESQCVLTV
jgi:hypothetical protein